MKNIAIALAAALAAWAILIAASVDALAIPVLIGISVVATLAPIVIGTLLILRRDINSRDVHRYVLGSLLIGLGCSTLVLNPMSNIVASFWLDERALVSLREACEGKAPENLYSLKGAPDATWTNADNRTHLAYYDISPWWSMWQQDLWVVVSNEQIVRVSLND